MILPVFISKIMEMNIIKALIDERIFAIEKEVEEQKIKLQDAKSFREQLNAIPVITPASMPNIAYILKRKERLKHYRIQLFIIGDHSWNHTRCIFCVFAI